MLQPANRLTLIDAMRPPARHRLESAMAVTFTLNLNALLAAPAAFALGGQRHATGGAGAQRPVELIHALRTHARKLTVFNEAGHIGLPTASRVFAFLEGAVVPVSAPRGGIVHPKVWVLRYQAAPAPEGVNRSNRRLRVLISSRNLTFDPSWDTVLRLDESAGSPGVQLGAIGGLFEGLLDRAVGTVSDEHSIRVSSLSSALRAAHFALPPGIDDLTIHVLGLNKVSPPFPETADRTLVISPFLTDDFFSQVCGSPVDELVSRQDSLDRLSKSTLKTIDKKWVLDSIFDDLSSADTSARTDDLARHRLSADDPGRPRVGLHAKVFAFEQRDRAYLFVGSANATGAAFRNNVEIMAELRGPVENLGIDRICGGDGDERGLRDLFNAYHRSPESDREDEHDDSKDLLDRARRRIAHLLITGTVEQTDSDGREWAATYRSTEPVPSADRTEIHCWPLSTSGHRRRIAAGELLEVRFETSLERVSGFLAFELSHADGAQTGFVVPVRLVGLPEQRDRRLVAALVGNAERFFRYLLALLYEEPARTDVRALVRAIDRGRQGSGRGLNRAVLEQLLGTMRRDPSKLLGLNPLIADLRKDEALPKDFAGLWDAIHAVAVEKAAEG